MVSERPFFSIIVPTYRSARFLKATFASLQRQTFADFEVIFVDDGSPDASQALMAEQLRADERMRMICAPNGGVSVARNRAMAEARGQYFHFYDPDDLLHPQLLEIVHRATQCDPAPVYFFEYCCDEAHTETVLDFEAIERRELSIASFDVIGNAAVWRKVFSRESVQGVRFLPGITMCEDHLFSLEVCARGVKLLHLNVPLYIYNNKNELSVTVTPFSVKKVQDLHTCIVGFLELFAGRPEFKTSFDLVHYELLPYLLKFQYRNCKRSRSREVMAAFAAQLRDLHSRGYLSPKGHKLYRYLIYRLLMARYA